MELSISAAYRGLCAPLRREGSRQHEAGARPCMAQPFCKLHLSLPSSAGIAMSFPAWAAEMSSSSSSQSSVESSTGTSSAASVGGYASQTVQSSAENAGDAASSTIDSAAAGNNDFLVNILGTAAFLALALLTVGVVYLFVTDFLEKRKGNEEIKRLNEEASGKKKQGSSRSLMAGSSGGGKGFGRKRPATDDDE